MEHITHNVLAQLGLCHTDIVWFTKLFPQGIITAEWTPLHQTMLLGSTEGRQFWYWAIAKGILPVQSVVTKDLRKASLRKADLRGVKLYGADLSGADLYRASLDGADLSMANLTGADISYASLRGAHLAGTNLRGADMSYSDLTGATLVGATLLKTDMTHTHLGRADLRGVDMTKAVLHKNCLYGAVMDGAQLGPYSLDSAGYLTNRRSN